MGAGVTSTGFRRRRGSRRHGGAGAGRMSEINVTPFVDVMLVLLIIFMVAAPLLTVGVPVELPKTQAKALSEDREPLTITIDAKGAVFLQETETALEEIVPRLLAISDSGYDQRIFVRADKGASIERFMEVLGLLSGAGFTRIGLMTDAAGPAAAKSR